MLSPGDIEGACQRVLSSRAQSQVPAGEGREEWSWDGPINGKKMDVQKPCRSKQPDVWWGEGVRTLD